VSELALRVRAESGAELVDVFEERALAIAASAAAPNTRRSYATAYRAFAGFLRTRYGEASVDTFTLAAVGAWRDHLRAQGLASSSVAQCVSAVRRLAAAVGADPLVAHVRCTQVQQERPSALSDLELSALLDDLPAGTGLSSGSSTSIIEFLVRKHTNRSLAVAPARVTHALDAERSAADHAPTHHGADRPTLCARRGDDVERSAQTAAAVERERPVLPRQRASERPLRAPDTA
jgi:hypothetical protein